MYGIRELIKAYKSGQIKPSEYISQLLQKAEELKDLNIFISIDSDQLMDSAKAADNKLKKINELPLLGVPVAVKDLIDVANMRSTMGSEIYKNAPYAKSDATLVKRLRDAGALIFGKANTHEFAYGSTGDVSIGGPVKNPVNTGHITGGSSSGSAAAVATGLSMVALGTDTSCSIRLPSAFCGVVGLKATYGLLPSTGVFPLSKTLDHMGHLSNSIMDSAIVLDVLTGAKEPASYTRCIGQSIANTTVGILSGSFFEDYVSEEINESMQKARQIFESQGARVIKIEIPDIQQIYDAQQLIIKVEAYHVHEKNLLNGSQFHPEVRERLMGGAGVLAEDYLKAIDYREQAQTSFDNALKQADVLISPVCGISPPLQGERISYLNGKEYSTPWILTRLMAPTNLSMHPGLTLPIGYDNKGLPIGVNLTGGLNEEARLYQFGRVLEEYK